jgi:hypothetical protein
MIRRKGRRHAAELEVIEQGDEHKGIRGELKKAAGYPRERDEEKRRIQPPTQSDTKNDPEKR